MRGPRAPLFLARAVYRQRRWRDAARLLPIFGLFLLLLPLLWGEGSGAGSGSVAVASAGDAGSGGAGVAAKSNSGQVAVYLFGVWALLIGLAAYVAPALAEPEADAPAEDV
ncbi:hypothetical protein GCM10010873_21670 [Cypionkella aquatica]|uniref:Uncharacterized protein n=1 Tax=Cypionkella aquatica TaxID=1756042 RepID=A0AA37TTI4_9RHOB|nr:hypothetical protein [Cypionkella aquatica]GLS87193.1 hypothetical protein GCM10010873_21670 [Cypionkella aquatica]